MNDRIQEPRVTIAHGVTAGLVIVGAAAIVLSLAMDNPLRQAVGPGAVPLWTALILTLAAVLELLRLSVRKLSAVEGRLEPAAGPAAEGRRHAWLLGLALLSASLLVWSVTGYIIGIVLAMLSVFVADRRAGAKGALIFSLLLAFGLWLLFERLLGTNLN